MVPASDVNVDSTGALGAIILCLAVLVSYNWFRKDKKTLSPTFKPIKSLGVKDILLLGMLHEVEGSKRFSFVISDPNLADNPIIFSSDGFNSLTQYSKSEVEGMMLLCS